MDFQSSIENLKDWGKENRQNLMLGVFLALGLLTGLGIGLLITSNTPMPIIIDRNAKITVPETILKDMEAGKESIVKPSYMPGGNFIASISGKAYYPANCEAAKKIKEENRIWFNSAEEARAQGYQPAKNCAF